MANYNTNTTLSNGTSPVSPTRVVNQIEQITADNVTVNVPANSDGDRRDFVLCCNTLGVTSNGGAASRWELPDCTLTMDKAFNHRFKQGYLYAPRSKILLMANVRLVFPCNVDNNSGVGFECDLTDAYIACGVAQTGTNGFVLHFGGANANGDIIVQGVTFGPNVVPQAIPPMNWTNVRFSDSSSSTIYPLASNYTRFVRSDYTESQEWSGFFGCDFTDWKEDSSELGATEHWIGLLNSAWEQNLGSRPKMFFLNCNLIASITNLKLYYDGQTSVINDGFTGVSGIAWKPAFSRPDGTDISTNFKLDFGSDDVYELQSTPSQTTSITKRTSSGGKNVRDFRTDGWAIEEDSVDVTYNGTMGDAANYTYRLDVNAAARSVKVFSYQDETWDTSGIIKVISTVKSPFSNAMVCGDAEIYVFNSTAQTSISKANAELLRAGTSTIDNLDDLLAAVRKDGFDNVNNLLVYSSNPTSGAIVVPSGVILSNTGSVLSVSSSIISGNFGALTGGSQYNTITGNIEFNANMNVPSNLTINGNLNTNKIATYDRITVTGAMNFSVAGVYTLDDCTINEVTNSSGGAVTINLVGGSTVTTNTDPNITILLPPIDVTFTDLQLGSQLVVYETGTTTEKFRTNNSGTSEQWTEVYTADINYDVTIQKTGLFPRRLTNKTASTIPISISINQSEDRAYQASSGLTYGTNANLNTTTKKFSVSVATTVQNYYSFWIEQWISNSALRNVEFPISTFGGNSFSFDGGYEFTSSSLQYLSRDGFRYFSNNLVTARYAAILSQGVVAGAQPEYQQLQNGSVTDAQNTGNVDQVIQIYGDATHGNFDYTNYLKFKVQANGYRQAEADIVPVFGTLEEQFYVTSLNTLQISNFTTGDPQVTGLSITDNTFKPC